MCRVPAVIELADTALGWILFDITYSLDIITMHQGGSKPNFPIAIKKLSGVASCIHHRVQITLQHCSVEHHDNCHDRHACRITLQKQPA